MARLLPAEVEPRRLQLGQHEAVADGCLYQLDALLGHGVAQTQVRHDGHDDRLLRQQTPLPSVDGADGDDLVAVDEVAVGVHREHPVGIPVERQTDVRP